MRQPLALAALLATSSGALAEPAFYSFYGCVWGITVDGPATEPRFGYVAPYGDFRTPCYVVSAGILKCKDGTTLRVELMPGGNYQVNGEILKDIRTDPELCPD